ncbi:hypothetical protein B0G62_10192 [Paraburkholderia eburnea]|uniref:Uncharacterized protein n=1 Tax=Paraburkholderia eburnea TaxID=1189126 RepID=A0A2S4MLQ1_9BURK|nr:hypothetical protein [Paraburkholderia eburnea]POR55698.1 hypothetical protein B0G62_10192 [Paraburkholderia eburnea]PRZ26826.1 hypothetical protein BX588_10192 [Paraburkholderia eburnea]
MSLPEWGNSYNALYVPLKGGWQCALVPARDIEDVDRGWQLSYEERQSVRKAREEQMARDRRDFDQLFRVGIGRKASRISADFSAYAGFVGKHVRGRWPTPIDGEDITRILREAVRDGLIVPAIDRDWRGSAGVSTRYAPQTWGETYRSGGGGGVAASTPRAKTFHQSVMESMGLDADGAMAYIEKYNAMVERIDAIQAANAARRAAAALAGNGDDFGVVVAAAGAVLGGGDDSNDSGDGGTSDDDLFSGDSGDDSTPLGDAQPFDYQPDMPDGDAEDLAAGDGRPGNNQAQNKQFRAVVKALGLNQDQARQLHDDIQDDDEMDYHGLMDRAQDLFGGSD